VSKTSIEDITGPARIAKGSFYKFYSSKEALFFELLEETQNRIRQPFLIPSSQKSTRTQFKNLVRLVVERIQSEPMFRFLGNTTELLVIARKVPLEVLAEHQQRDAIFIKAVIDRWKQKQTKPHKDKIAAHMSLLLMIQHNDTVLGDRLYPFAEEAIITSFANCFFD